MSTRFFSALLFFFLLFTGPSEASIIKFPKGDNKDLSYKELTCTDDDKANIHEIITTMAQNGKLSLLLKQGHLKQLGAQINHVHPLKFLATIFSNPDLKACMPDIFDDYFKRNGFMDGLGSSLDREFEKGKLEQYLKEFATEVHVPVESIRTFFEARDWESLVRHLMNS